MFGWRKIFITIFFNDKRPKSPKEISHFKHYFNIFLHSFVLARIERANLFNFFFCHFFIDLKSRTLLIVVIKTAFIHQISNVIGDIIQTGVLEIYEQNVLLSVHLLYENIVIVNVIVTQPDRVLAFSELLFGFLFQFIELLHKVLFQLIILFLLSFFRASCLHIFGLTFFSKNHIIEEFFLQIIWQLHLMQLVCCFQNIFQQFIIVVYILSTWMLGTLDILLNPVLFAAKQHFGAYLFGIQFFQHLVFKFTINHW